MFNNVSVDGYFAGPDGNLDWVVHDKDIDKMGAGSTGTFDTVLFGRRTYELFESFWPKVVSDSPTAPNPHDTEQLSPEMRAMGVFLNDATKLVFSRTLKKVGWKNSLLLPELDLREMEAMKKQPGKDMIMFGSGSIVTQLTKHRLIDEYQFVVSPVILGDGRPLMGGESINLALELLEAKRYPSGIVMLRYMPGRRQEAI